MKTDVGSIPMDDPLAFYLTWTTYGTWLPGDERGWVAKPGQFKEPDAKLKAAARRLMTEPALTLDVEQRRVVEKTIADHCKIRGWYLHAVNCRTKHVHVVVTAPKRDPEDVMDQFKAWCTRRLKELEKSCRGVPFAGASGLYAPAIAGASGLYVPANAGASGLCAPAIAGASGLGADPAGSSRRAAPARPSRRAIRQNWWTQRGSKRSINDEASLEAAVRYVLEGQGSPTPHKPEAPAKESDRAAQDALDPRDRLLD